SCERGHEGLCRGITLGQRPPTYRAVAPIASRNRRSRGAGGAIACETILLSGLLIGHEEKQLVFLDWATEHTAILVRVQHRLGESLIIPEPGVRIKSSIAEKFKGRPMETV